MNIVGATPGGGGSVDPVTPPADTSEAVASGGSPAAKTFSAFDDPGGRIASYSASLVTVAGSGTLSGSGLGAYTISGTADGDAYSIVLDALDSGGDIVATAVHSIRIAASGSTGWTTLHEFDASGGDVTDVTVTKGGGATIVYASDGTTEIAVVEHFDRAGPSSATCRVTTSDAALFLQGAGTNYETNATIVPPSSVSVPDFTDPGLAVRVDYILTGTTQNLGHVLSVLGGPDSSSAAADGTVGFQIQQTSGPNYPFRVKRNLSGQAFSSDYATVPTAEITDLAVSVIVRLGRHVEIYASEQSTYLADDPSGATYVGQMGDIARAINSDTDLFTSEHLNVNLGVFTTNGNPSNLSVSKARWRTGVGV